MQVKKLLAILLVVLTFITLLFSCGTDETSDTDEKSNAEASKETSNPENDDPLSHIEKQNIGRDIAFLVEGDYREGYKSIEICEHEDSSINDAIRLRNEMVEEKLGVKIVERRTESAGDMVNLIRLSAQGGEVIDIAMPYITDAAPLVSEGYFANLYNYDDILMLDEPYWDQNAKETISIKNKLYFMTGDFSLLMMDVTHCMLFNRKLITLHNLEDPYDLVEEGKWTLDKMMEMAKEVTAENGDGTWDWKDTYGLFINDNYSNSLFIGAGESFIKKNTDDEPELAIMSSTSPSAADKINAIFNSEDSIRIESFQNEALSAGYSSCYYAARESVAEDRGLFITISLSDIIRMAEYGDAEYGLLVTPKLNEAQGDYRSYISVIFGTSCVIPVNAPNPEESALVLEALTAASTDTIKKDYYERVLKLQKIKDDRSEKMLDFIFDNRVYDLGAIFNWGGLRDFLTSAVVQSGTSTFRSKYESEASAIQAAIDSAMNDINSMK